MKLQPLFDNVILKPITQKAEHGIVIPDSVDQDRPERGEVVAIGDGCQVMDNTRFGIKEGLLYELKVQPGDKVVFRKYSPDEVEVDGEKYLLITEDEILAIEI